MFITLRHLPPWTDRQTSHCHHSSAIISVWSTYLCHWLNHLFPFAKKVTVIPLCWPGYPLKFYLQIQPLLADTKELYLYHSHLRFLICDFIMSTFPERIMAKVICPCCCMIEACNCKVFRARLLQVPWYLIITHFNIKILWSFEIWMGSKLHRDQCNYMPQFFRIFHSK